MPVVIGNVELAPECKVKTLDPEPEFKVYRGQVRISQLAESAGVPTSTVRYYERVGLMSAPARTASGYRDYADDAAARLRFITRARRMGLSCEQITTLIPVWAGTNCGAAQERVGRLLDEKQQDIAERIAELQQLSDQLDTVRESLDAEPPLAVCRHDLTCCVPESPGRPVAIELAPRH